MDTTKCTVIDEYGEIVTEEYNRAVWDIQRPHVKAEVEEELKHQYNRTAKQQEAYERIQARDELQNLLIQEYGSFIFTQYKELLNILRDEKGNVDSAFTFRFIYLATYMDYDNILRFGKRFRGKHTDYMTMKDLPEVMGLSRKQIWEFKNKLEQYDLVSVKADGRITINKGYCKKGKLAESYKKDSIRCFEESIQQLYLDSLPKEHKKIGVFIQLLPHLNFNHNVICFNPNEEDAYKLKEITIQDVCRIIGHDVAHARRFQKELFNITIGGEYVIGKFTYGRCPEAFIINPVVYYKGNKMENLKGIMNLFKLGSIN